MDIRNRRSLKAHAKTALQQASFDTKKLMLIYAGVNLGIPLLLAALSLFLEDQIQYTGGLDGMATRAILVTAQQVLSLAAELLLPFWNIGIVSVALLYSRRQGVRPGNLLDGLRRFGPLLRLMLLQFLFGALLIMPCTYLTSPLSALLLGDRLDPLVALTQQYMNDPAMDMDLLMEQITTSGLEGLMYQLLILPGIVFALVMGYFLLRARFAQYAIMDESRTGALKAIFLSFRMTKGNCIALIKLDLSFWWYYLLQLLLAGIHYTWLWLSLAGIPLPISDTAAMFASYGVFALASLGVHLLFTLRVETTYAAAYESLAHPE